MLNLKMPMTIVSAIVMILTLNACSLRAIKQQSKQLEGLAQISGYVSANFETDSPINVVTLSYDNNEFKFIEQVQIDGNGRYQFSVLPGNYLIGAYIDDNNNHTREINESATMHDEGNGGFTEITLTHQQKMILPALSIDKNQNIGKTRKVTYDYSKIGLSRRSRVSF